MAKINFAVCGADIEYELHDLGRREELWINGESIIDCCGDVRGWGEDYRMAVAGLHGAAKESATFKYLRTRAEQLIIQEIFSLRETVREQPCI